jgi:hypothetical protein
MAPWLALTVITATLGWWWLSMRAREAAVRAARGACRRFSVQLLDETVALSRLRLARGRDGRLHLWRLYRFEFSQTGGERFGGHVVLLGGRLMDAHLEAVDEYAPPARNRLQ